MHSEMEIAKEESPQRHRIATPRRLLLDTSLSQPSLHQETFSLRSPINSPRGVASIAASSIFSSRRTSFVCMALASIFLMELLRWQTGMGSLTLSSKLQPCNNLNDWKVDVKRNHDSSTTIENEMATPSDQNKTHLDFAIVGFPKTGTTFLIYALEQHPQVLMPPEQDWSAPYEFCAIHHPEGDKELKKWLQNASSLVNTSSISIKFGIKCPTMVRATNAIENLMKVSDSTKLIIGVRHPVLWFQSFYNYRVYEKYSTPEIDSDPIPSPFTLNKERQWRDVSIAYAKFDNYLKQLMKTTLNEKELRDMLDSDSFWEKRMTPNPYKIFIYTDEQLNDNNATQQSQFRHELQQFLDLKTPLVDFNSMPEMNKNSKVYPEYIDLCNKTYSSIKHELLKSGKKSSQWITDKFINSNDVVVANREFFVNQLRRWGTDPCVLKSNT